MDYSNPSVWLLVLSDVSKHSSICLYFVVQALTHSFIHSFTYSSTHSNIQHISPDLPISSDHLDPFDLHSTRAIAWSYSAVFSAPSTHLLTLTGKTGTNFLKKFVKYKRDEDNRDGQGLKHNKPCVTRKNGRSLCVWTLQLTCCRELFFLQYMRAPPQIKFDVQSENTQHISPMSAFGFPRFHIVIFCGPYPNFPSFDGN